MFYIFALIVSVASGQPVDVMISKDSFADVKACEVARPEWETKFAAAVDEGTHGQFKVARTLCSTKEDMTPPDDADKGRTHI